MRSSTRTIILVNVTAVSKRIDQVWLVRAAGLFTVAVLVHNFDHTRRGSGSVDTDVAVAGTLAIFVEVGVVLLAAMRHPEAPRAAVASGLALAAGYCRRALPARPGLAQRLVPERRGREPVLVGGRLLRGRRRPGPGLRGLAAAQRPGTVLAPRSLGEGIRHPVPAAMLVGNVVLLIAGAF